MQHPEPEHSKPARIILLWMLPLALWALSTAYFGFDLGKYSDDWAFSLRTPETDTYAWPASPFVRWNYFWRPLDLVAAYGLQTAFWRHDWVCHAVSALAHLLAGVLLFRLLARVGIRDAVAAGAAMLFLAFPIAYEAPLWPAAIGLPAGTACVLGAALIMARFAARAPDGKPWGKALRMAALVFAAACCHEQAGACSGALALLYLAACPREQPWAVRARRMIVSVGACGLACALYIGLLVGTAPGGKRGSAASLVGLDQTDDRLGSFARQLGAWLWGGRAHSAAIDAGERGAAMMSGSAAGWVWIGACACALVAWIAVCSAMKTRASARGSAPSLAWLAAFGLGAGVLSLVPVALTRNNPVYSRYFYTVGLGIAIALAAGAEAALRRADRRPRAFAALSAALAILAAGLSIWGACAMVFWQSAFRERSNLDRVVGDGLARLVPPPPGAVIVPVTIEPAQGAAARVPGAMEQPWSCWALVQRALRRSDVSATHLRPVVRGQITADERGITYMSGLRDQWGRVAAAPTLVPWDKAVPIRIGSRGEVIALDRQEAIERIRKAKE